MKTRFCSSVGLSFLFFAALSEQSSVTASPFGRAGSAIDSGNPLIETVQARRGGARVNRGAAVARGPRGGAVAVRGTSVARPGYRPGVTPGRAVVVAPGLRRPSNYWWRPGGAIAAGAAVGFVTAAAAASYAGSPPAAGYCWYYTNSSRTQGFWDQCP